MLMIFPEIVTSDLVDEILLFPPLLKGDKRGISSAPFKTRGHIGSLSWTIHTRDKPFAFQLVHYTGIDEFAPIALLFDLHELQKHIGIFRSRLRHSGKDLEPEVITL